MLNARENFRLRSFVCRNSRRTAGQERAFNELWPKFGLKVEDGLLDIAKVFTRPASVYLEIGFGTGHSLIALAKANPDCHFIGIETHKPGIGALFLGIESNQLSNLRVYHADAVDVLNKCIPDASLDGIQLFFPDPWPKRRHHPRRIIQANFVKLLLAKLKPGGQLHLATDWEDYARHMLKVITQESGLINLAGNEQFSARSPRRPVFTKFEQRALREGRKIFDLQSQKSV